MDCPAARLGKLGRLRLVQLDANVARQVLGSTDPRGGLASGVRDLVDPLPQGDHGGGGIGVEQLRDLVNLDTAGLVEHDRQRVGRVADLLEGVPGHDLALPEQCRRRRGLGLLIEHLKGGHQGPVRVGTHHEPDSGRQSPGMHDGLSTIGTRPGRLADPDPTDRTVLVDIGPPPVGQLVTDGLHVDALPVAGLGVDELSGQVAELKKTAGLDSLGLGHVLGDVDPGLDDAERTVRVGGQMTVHLRGQSEPDLTLDRSLGGGRWRP